MKQTQIFIFAIVALLSWYGMMAIHEIGHCVGALLTGAKIETVVVPLIGFSRTDFSGGISPIVVVFAGPVLGELIPLLLLIIPTGKRLSDSLRFFIGFCLATNGAYIGMDVFILGGDSRQLLQLGVPVLILIFFGIVSFSAGIYTWHTIGDFKTWFRVKNEETIEQRAP